MRELGQRLRIWVTMRSSSSMLPAEASVLASAQLGGQQVPAAEDVQRQVAVTAVAMEETPFLLAVQRVVGGVQIEDDLVRCLLVRLDEARDEQRLEGRRIERSCG